MARKKGTSAAATGSDARPEITIEEIPLRRPDRSYAKRNPNHKTLIDLIEEHHPSVRIQGNSDGRIEELPDSPSRDGDDEDENEADEDAEMMEYMYGPSATATYLAVPLSILMFGLDILCHQQYSQEPILRDIAFKCVKALPVFFLITYLFHPRKDYKLAQLLIFAASVAAGCWMVKATNRYAYYAVMKRAPQVGSLWVWTVIEMDKEWALLSLLTVFGWGWYSGYSFMV